MLQRVITIARHPLLRSTSSALTIFLYSLPRTARKSEDQFAFQVVPSCEFKSSCWILTTSHTLKIFTWESFSNSLVSTGEVDISGTADILLLKRQRAL